MALVPDGDDATLGNWLIREVLRSAPASFLA
jgi:hypothetical protein